MIFETLVLFIEFAVQTVFLFVALWIMIKIQKLDYNFPGLLGTAAIVSGLDQALDTVLGHFLGIYLANYISTPIILVVLIICVSKVTHADRVDVMFTIMVGYALMFGMNLWLFGALLGDLRPPAGNSKEFDAAMQQPETNEVEQMLPGPISGSKCTPATHKRSRPAGSATEVGKTGRNDDQPFFRHRDCPKRLQFGGDHSNRKANLYYFPRRIGLDANAQRPGFRAFQGTGRWLGGADHQRRRNEIAVPLTRRWRCPGAGFATGTPLR